MALWQGPALAGTVTLAHQHLAHHPLSVGAAEEAVEHAARGPGPRPGLRGGGGRRPRRPGGPGPDPARPVRRCRRGRVPGGGPGRGGRRCGRRRVRTRR
ncbi:hypothetical protein [Streptomyces sp. AB3(2024)]|uniref:hypothetical protein n=1 Tax=Streptomyces sp. AB3(2024) TaxID=3317321 RepID=UPI0035A3A5EB